MVPWRAIDTGGLGAVGMAREVGELARFRSVISSFLYFLFVGFGVLVCGWFFLVSFLVPVCPSASKSTQLR